MNNYANTKDDFFQCENGHYYDPEKYRECPVCKNKRTAGTTNAAAKMEAVYRTDTRRVLMEAGDDDDDVTMAAVEKRMGFNPIAGWLVCISGPYMGKDYRIHTENNFIGRDRSMDICLTDHTVSRKNHAILSFDERVGKYYYVPGMDRNIDRINDKAVLTPTELHAGDVIEIGSQKLQFVPLCGTSFKWEDWKENEKEN